MDSPLEPTANTYTHSSTDSSNSDKRENEHSSKSVKDIPVKTRIPLRHHRSSDSLIKDHKLNVNFAMHDDSKTRFFEETRKLNKRKSKQNLETLNEQNNVEQNEIDSVSYSSISRNSLPRPIKLEFSPVTKKKSPLPDIGKCRSMDDIVTSVSKDDVSFDDNDNECKYAARNSESIESMSTVKGSVSTKYADSSHNTLVNNSDAGDEEIDNNAIDRCDTMSAQHSRIDDTQTEDISQENGMNYTRKSEGSDQDISSSPKEKRAVTPFFLKQVDISEAILKVDPKLTKDLSLISIDTPTKPRKSRGESLMSHGGTSAYSRSSTAGEGNASNIRVTVRVRPMNSIEKQRGDKTVIEFPGEGGIWVQNSMNQTKPFTFNAVFQEHCSQEVVFNESGITDLIDKALDGFSCTAFAFGQTGSGKTYTITGPPDQSAEDMLSQGGSYGMVPRSFRYLFDEISNRSGTQYLIKASFLEVYNEKVKDLLHPSNAVDSLPLRWSSKTGFYVDNLFLIECETVEDLMEALIKGSTYRQVGEHAMNDHSSRSHTMLTVYVDSEEVDTDEDTNGFVISKKGKISFVDLAGSEKVKETKTTGETFVESNNINKSLLTLGNCISGLGDPRKKGQHIPYRESKLTKLLADSLGGEGFTLMVACISPSSYVLQDTMNTLRYANRAKNIKNKPVVKMDPKEQFLHRMKRELKLLRAENLYFREQLGVPCSESQIIMTPSQIKGELTPHEQSGTLSPAIGNGTFSSTQSSRNSSSKELNNGRIKESSFTSKDDSFTPRATTALYALGAKNGLYNMLQEYMNENASLKAENMELHRTRAVARHQQEELFRENDRLAKKLDDLGRVMLSTPMSREHVRNWISDGPSPADIFTRQRTEDTLSLETGSIRSNGSGVRFPPVRHGIYPNYVYNHEVVTELQNEKSKLEKERERILLERSEQTNTLTLSTDVKLSHDDRNPNNVNNSADVVTMSNSKENKGNNERRKIEKKQTTQANQSSDRSNGTTSNSKKQEGRFKKAVLSKAWKTKKKAVVNDKPTKSSYAEQFAMRKNLLSKQNTTTNQNKTETKDINDNPTPGMTEPQVAHQHAYAVQQPALMQHQYPQQGIYQNPYVTIYPNAVGGFYNTPNNVTYPYGNMASGYPTPVRDLNNPNQHVPNDLNVLNGQINQEIISKKSKPKR